MKKRFFFVFLYLLCIGFLTACTTKPTVISPSHDLTTRDALFSNAILFPNNAIAHLYWPPSKKLTDTIREAGGEIYQSGSFVTIVLPADALFEPATAVLLPNAETLIDTVAQVIIRFSDENVIITAHTDNIGSELYQAKLSHQQAQLFALALWQNKNIDLTIFKRFKYAGMGDTRPITENPDAYGQALNRRIQITLYPSASMEEMYQSLEGNEIDQI